MKLGFFVAGIALAGCAPAFDAYADARIAHQQAVDQFYDQIGYTAALEKMDAAGVTPSSGGGSRVQPNAYGLGMGMDQYGRAVPHDPMWR